MANGGGGGYGSGYGGGFRQPSGFGGQGDQAFNTAFGQRGQGVQNFGGQPAYAGGAYSQGVTGEGAPSPFYRSPTPSMGNPSAQPPYGAAPPELPPWTTPGAPPPELPPWVTPGTPGTVGAKGGAITGGPMFPDQGVAKGGAMAGGPMFPGGRMDYGYNPGDQGYAGPGQYNPWAPR